MHDPWMDRLSEYTDGDLTTAEAAALEAHLVECPACRDVLAELRHVALATAGLVDRAPGNDLWPAILDRIRSEPAQNPGAADILPFEAAGRTRRFSFSVPQLLAASIALMAVSGTAAWLGMAASRTAPVPVALETAGANAPATLGSDAAVLISSVTNEYDRAIDELQKEFQARRDRLDPETVRVVEENLRVIDEAVAEARAALAREPANGYLYRHLDNTLTKKVDLLRRAAGAGMAAT